MFFSSFPRRTVFSSFTKPSVICQKNILEVIHIGIKIIVRKSTQKNQNSTLKPWFSRACDDSRFEKKIGSSFPENQQGVVDARNRYINFKQKNYLFWLFFWAKAFMLSLIKQEKMRTSVKVIPLNRFKILDCFLFCVVGSYWQSWSVKILWNETFLRRIWTVLTY